MKSQNKAVSEMLADSEIDLKQYLYINNGKPEEYVQENDEEEDEDDD